ncbi:MAG: shikimate kinase [Acidimicrobiia bacterium]|nr:MAG: shikimate kinase [Acidimicrobiia bacterium]
MATLWLVGMMGVGKSTVGPIVAETLGREFVDTDEEVEHRSGMSVAEWVRHDLAGFRSLEDEVVEELAGGPLAVACGGGVILSGKSRRLMRRSGMVVWLVAPLDVLVARLGSAEDRPLLTDDPAVRLRRILGERRRLYRRAAHAEVDATGTAEVVAGEVVAAWNAFR